MKKLLHFALGAGVAGLLAIAARAGDAPAPAPATPWRIMAVGDSITVGYTDNPNWSVPFEFGYRAELFRGLTNRGYRVQFVGGSPEPFDGRYKVPLNVPKFDLRRLGQDHCRGYGGWGTKKILANIGAWLKTDEPDIVLLMAGINDIHKRSTEEPSAAAANLSNIVQAVLDHNPRTYVIVAQITPYSAHTEAIVRYNDYIRTRLVPFFVARGHRVSTVDQYANFGAAGSRTVDATLYANGNNHPNAVGYARMAQTWLAGITALGLPAPAPGPAP